MNRQRGMVTVAFAILIMSALGVLALGMVKAQWIGERASGAQKTYAERFVAEEALLVKTHVEMNNQEMRKALFSAANCPTKISADSSVKFAWLSNCQSGDRSRLVLQVLNPVDQQVARARGLKVLDLLLREMPAVPLVAGGTAVIEKASWLDNRSGNVVAITGAVANVSKDSRLSCTAASCLLQQNDARVRNGIFSVYFDAEKIEEVKPYASPLPPQVGHGAFHWVEGDLQLTDETYGSPEMPLLLVVKGNLVLSRRTIIHGIVIVLEGSAEVPGSTIIGLLAAEGSIHTTEAATIIHSAAIIKAVRNTVGPYVEVLGSWRDF